METTRTYFKQIISTLLALVICVGVVANFATVETYAKDYGKYSTLDAIPEDLNIFNVIAYGNISAVKSGSNWYYKFTRNGNSIMIKTSAFMGTPKNTHFTKDLSALNASLKKNSNDNYSRIGYFWKQSISSYGTGKKYTSTYYRSKIEVNASNGLSDETVKIKLTNGITFSYRSKIFDYENFDYAADHCPVNKNQNGYSLAYVTPSTGRGYVAALSRSTSLQNVVPTITIDIGNNNRSNSYLSTYSVAGKGKINKSANITDFVSIVKGSASVVKKAVTGDALGTFSSLASLIGNVKTTLYKKSDYYNTGERNTLSVNYKYVITAKVKSPITLSKTGDWFQVVTHLNSTNGYINTTYTKIWIDIKL